MDERLKVTEHVLFELEKMKEEGADASRMIWFLYRAGLPKPGALIALRRAGVMPVSETKTAIHYHEAYAERRSSDEEFEEALVHGLQALEKQGHIAAA